MSSSAETKSRPWFTLLTLGAWRPKVRKTKQEPSRGSSRSAEKRDPPTGQRKYMPRYAQRDAAMCLPAANRGDVVSVINLNKAILRREYLADQRQERERRASLRAVGMSDASSGRARFSQYYSHFAPYQGTTDYAKVDLAYQDMHGRGGSPRPSSLRSAGSERQVRHRRSAIAGPSPLEDVEEAAEGDGTECLGEDDAISPTTPAKKVGERASWHPDYGNPYAWKGDLGSLMSASGGTDRRAVHRKSAGDLEAMSKRYQRKGKASVVQQKSAGDLQQMCNPSSANMSPALTQTAANNRLQSPLPVMALPDNPDSATIAGPFALPDDAALQPCFSTSGLCSPGVPAKVLQPGNEQRLPMHQRRFPCAHHGRSCQRAGLGSQPTRPRPEATGAGRSQPRLDSFEGPDVPMPKQDVSADVHCTHSLDENTASVEMLSREPWSEPLQTTTSVEGGSLPTNTEATTTDTSKPPSTKESTASSDLVESRLQTQPATPPTPAENIEPPVDGEFNEEEMLDKVLKRVRDWLAWSLEGRELAVEREFPEERRLGIESDEQLSLERRFCCSE